MTTIATSTTGADAPRTGNGRTTEQRAAGLAAIGYLAIFVLAIFANFMALGSVLDPGDAVGTARALAEQEQSFRLGAIAFVIIMVADVAVAWALHVVFRPVGADLSLLAAWMRLAYAVILGAALSGLYVALWLTNHPDAFGDSHPDAVLLALQAFDLTWVIGLAAFGVHLLVVGVLLRRSAGPVWLAAILMIAGAAYVIDTVAHLALADYEAWSDGFLVMVMIPSVVGEFAFTVWLVLRARVRRAQPAV